MKCRYSGQEIPRLMSFGQMPLGNGFVKEQHPEEEYFFEMSISVNNEIGLLQLEEQPDPKKMFHESYAFFSRSSAFMKEHFKNMAQEITNLLDEKFSRDESQFVVEIGSNDGVMLEHLVNNGIKCLGVEPSLNVAEYALLRRAA